MATIYTGAAVFDGTHLHPGGRLRVADGRVTGPGPGTEVHLDGGILAPGFLDLQVNGGAGRMVDGTIDAAGLALICDAHAGLGATGILPTLITDTPGATASVLAAGIEAARRGTAGFLGLHLEGPHLDPRRKGAHDPALIRPMGENDLVRLLHAVERLPALMVTVAPEAVRPDQIARLRAAGVVVSLGHTDCGGAEAAAAFAAGATCVTHLFNAMSQLGNREPGMVGAALARPVHAGLIADGVHVAVETMRIALAAKPEGLFLVSDAMAVAGTRATEFTLGGRRIVRQGGRLTLADGTLAGADLTLPQAMRVMVTKVGTPPVTALAMATSRPAACLGRTDGPGHLREGHPADMVHLTDTWALQSVWRGGQRLAQDR